MIIPDLDTLKGYVSVLANDVEWSDLEPYIKLADTLVKDDILGGELHADIITNIADPAYTDIVDLCRQIIAHRAFYEGIPYLDIVLTANGFAVVSNNNVAPASKERVQKLRTGSLALSDKFTEVLFDYLEATAAYHAKWKPSLAYLRYSDCLIKTAKELALLSNWEGLRTEYLKTRVDLQTFTATHLHPYLSKDLIVQLIVQQNASTLTDPNKVILPKIKQTLGCLIANREREAAILMGDVLAIIDGDLDNYLAYKDSSEYEARLALDYVNTVESTIFVFGK